MEEPTSLVDFDPAKMMREAEMSKSRPPFFSRPITGQEDETRDVDVDSLLAEEGIDVMPGSRRDPPTLTGENLSKPAAERGPRSMSEIEWDLD
jgi:hypothetical protein